MSSFQFKTFFLEHIKLFPIYQTYYLFIKMKVRLTVEFRTDGQEWGLLKTETQPSVGQ